MLSSLLTTGAAVAGVIIAWFALDTWRAQIRGQATFDAAKRFMIAANDLALQWHNARAPLVELGEFPAGYQDDNEHTREEAQQAYRHVFRNRWEPVGRAYTGVIALLPEVRALFPPAVADAAESLLLTARELRFYMDEVIDLKKYDFDAMEAGEAKTQLLEQRREAQSGAFAPYPRAGTQNRNALTQKFSDQHAELARQLKSFLHVS